MDSSNSNVPHGPHGPHPLSLRTPNPQQFGTSPSQSSLLRLRTAASTPMSSPGLLGPPSHTANSPRPDTNPGFSPGLAMPAPPVPVPVRPESAVPLLHPLQKHKVRETHKALIDSHEVTGRKLINQYEVIEELGRGMHGKVKLARHTATGESVAIKIIPRFSKKRRLGKVMVSPQDKTKKEIAILKKIRHNNVVALIEVIDDPELKKIYMVLEHVELGEIVWRKKGLPSICQYERRRIEREMQGESMTAEEERYYQILEHRAALNEMRRARQQQQASQLAGAGDHMWSLEHGGSAGDSSPLNRSRIPSRDDLADFELGPALVSNPPSAQPSRANSRSPSCAPSNRSSVAGLAVFAEGGGGDMPPPQPSSYALPSSLSLSQSLSQSPYRSPYQHPQETGGWGEIERVEGPRSYRSQHSSAFFDHSPSLGTGGGGAVTSEDVAAAFRGRSPSMADSLFSHMSSVDFNTHHEDPFADDFSYVPCFTIEQARSTFRDTVLGLEYLHYQGVVHRDIKPANLLWTRDHQVKISDFGVSYFGRPIREGESGEAVAESEARDFDDDLELAKTVGTPAFFAPELCYTDPDPAKGSPKVSEQIDVWSLGVTLYCLVFARIPFLAEDEYQMFKKIASQDVFIPRRRLRPVDPLTAPTSTSLYQTHAGGPSGAGGQQYRDDSERSYEDVDADLQDLLSQMLIKDPEKRIKLRDIKRHRWVLMGVADPARWLEDTDPARPSSGRRIQVDEREMTDAVVPLRFLDRARSMVRKTVQQLMSPLTDRAESRSRRRAASSSAASSVAGNDGLHASAAAAAPTQQQQQQPPLLSRDSRRPGFRGEEQLSGRAAASPSPSSTTEHHQLTWASLPASPGAEVGYDPLATVLASGNLHHQQQQLQQEQLQKHHHPYHRSAGQLRAAPASSHRRSESMAVETGSEPEQQQHQQHQQLHHHLHYPPHKNHHRLVPTTASPGPPRRHSYARPPSYVFPTPQTPATPAFAGQPPQDDHLHMPPFAMAVDRDAVERETSRSRSVDRALSLVAEAKVGLTPAVARGSSLHSRRPRPVRSVDLGRSFDGATLPHVPLSAGPLTSPGAPFSPTSFSPRALRAEYRHPYPGSDPDMLRRFEGRRGSLPFGNLAGSFCPLEESALRQQMMDLPHVRLHPTIREGSVSPASIPLPASPPPAEYGPDHDDGQPSSREETTTEAQSSRSTSCVDLGTPLTSSSEASSPVSEVRKALVEQFQSDPSLPALLSGASSVSTDLEGELLTCPGIVGPTTTLLDTTESLTPPALPKEPVTGFPLEPEIQSTTPQPEFVAFEFPASPRAKEVQRPRSAITGTPVNDDDDDHDSDSDGGLVMAKRRGWAPTDANRRRPAAPVYRRRDTSASTGSNETAKRV